MSSWLGDSEIDGPFDWWLSVSADSLAEPIDADAVQVDLPECSPRVEILSAAGKVC